MALNFPPNSNTGDRHTPTNKITYIYVKLASGGYWKQYINQG